MLIFNYQNKGLLKMKDPAFLYTKPKKPSLKTFHIHIFSFRHWIETGKMGTALLEQNQMVTALNLWYYYIKRSILTELLPVKKRPVNSYKHPFSSRRRKQFCLCP